MNGDRRSKWWLWAFLIPVVLLALSWTAPAAYGGSSPAAHGGLHPRAGAVRYGDAVRYRGAALYGETARYTDTAYHVVQAQGDGAPTMPPVDGGTVWAGEDGVFQQWEDGSWVYVWRPAPGEGPPETRWPEREIETQNTLTFAGRPWRGGYLVRAGEAGMGDRVLAAQDEGGEWYMALFIPAVLLAPCEGLAPCEDLEARAGSIVQALQGMRLEE